MVRVTDRWFRVRSATPVCIRVVVGFEGGGRAAESFTRTSLGRPVSRVALVARQILPRPPAPSLPLPLSPTM